MDTVKVYPNEVTFGVHTDPGASCFFFNSANALAAYWDAVVFVSAQDDDDDVNACCCAGAEILRAAATTGSVSLTTL